MSDDPLYYYVRDKGSPVAHHWDYARSRTDHALCGHAYQAPVWEGEDRPRAVCRACQALLSPHEARWWRDKAEFLETELEALKDDAEGLRRRLAELEEHLSNQRDQLRQLNATLGRQTQGIETGTWESDAEPGRLEARPGAEKKSKGEKRKKGKGPDNSREAILRRLRDESGPMSAADISASSPRPFGGRPRVVSGGLPGLGKRRR